MTFAVGLLRIGIYTDIQSEGRRVCAYITFSDMFTENLCF